MNGARARGTQFAVPTTMRAICVFFATLAFVLLVAFATGSVAMEWILRDVPRPAAPRDAPTLAHRGLACITTPSNPGWLRSALIRHPAAEAVARRQVVSLKRRTLERVPVEWALSVWLSRHYDDDQLARLAGDTVWLGRGAYGLDEAARAWFGEPLDRLSLAQSAVLVGLEQSPRSYDPSRAPERAQRRRQYVLHAWETCGLIAPGSADALAPTPVLDGVLPLATRLAPVSDDED